MLPISPALLTTRGQSTTECSVGQTFLPALLADISRADNAPIGLPRAKQRLVVDFIPAKRVATLGQVDANLMGPPSFQPAFHQGQQEKGRKRVMPYGERSWVDRYSFDHVFRSFLGLRWSRWFPTLGYIGWPSRTIL